MPPGPAPGPPAPPPTLYLVVCAAPPAQRVDQLAELLAGDGWRTYAITTPTAASWVDADRLAAATGEPVRWRPRDPGQPGSLPPADAVAVVPATFNTINKWAAGISDTFALGILNEALGIPVPVVVSPYAKPALATHPAFGRSLTVLRDCGVHLTATEALRPASGEDRFRWSVVREVLYALRPGRQHAAA